MRIITILFSLILFHSFLFSADIDLEKGQEFTIRTSSFTFNADQNKADLKNEELTERFDQIDLHFKIVDESEDDYEIAVYYDRFNHYDRIKKNQDENWKTGISYNKSLVNQDIAPFLQKMFGLYTSFTIHLQKNGKVKNIQLSDTSLLQSDDQLFNAKEYIITNIVEQFFTPKLLIDNNNIDFKKYKWAIEGNDKPEFNDTKFQYKNIDNGGILESINSKLISTTISNRYNNTNQKASSLPKQQIVTGRTHLLVENDIPYHCTLQLNSDTYDTTFERTNVTIRGKILNPSSKNNKVSVYWNQRTPGLYKRYKISSELKPDNTFEIRFFTDGIRKISFGHSEYCSFYVLPGDNIELSVDAKYFDESVRATGIGSKHVNFMLDEFLFCEKNKLLDRNIRDSKKLNCIELTPLAYKKYYLDILKKKIDFIEKYKTTIAPEVYLAKYYDEYIFIASILKDYSRNQKYYRSKENLEPYNTEFRSHDMFKELIHPDNDLMAFSSMYTDEIRDLVFYGIDDEFKNITGKGNLIYTNNFF